MVISCLPSSCKGNLALGPIAANSSHVSMCAVPIELHCHIICPPKAGMDTPVAELGQCLTVQWLASAVLSWRLLLVR
jgi:hypothetical protein